MSDKIDVSAQVTVTDEATGPIEQVQRALHGLSAQARRMSEQFRTTLGKGAFGGVEANLAKLHSSFGALHTRVAGVIKPFAALMGLTGGVTLAGTVAGMKDFAAEAVKVGKAAKMLGIEDTPERLDALGYAAKKSGLDFDEFVAAVGKGDLQLRKAFTGENKKLAGLLKMPGDLIPKTTDITGARRPMIDMLQDISKLVVAQKSVGAQRDILTAFFGKGGMSLLPLMQRGPEGIQKLIDRGMELSPIFKQNVTDAKAFNEAYKTSQEEVTDLGQDIEKYLLPKFTPLLKMIADVVKLLKPEIFTAVTSAVDDFGASLQNVKAEDVVAGLKEWWTWGKEIYQMLGGWKTILLGVAAVMVGPWVAALAVATAAMVTFTAAVISNPAVAAALAVIAVAAFLIYRYWAPLKGFFIRLWDGIRAAFQSVVGWWNTFLGLFTAETLWRLWEPFGTEIAGLWTGVKQIFARAWAGLKWFWDQFVPDPIKKAWEAIPAVFDRIWDSITSAVTTAWNVIKPILTDMRDAMQWVFDHLPELPQGGFMVPGTPNPRDYRTITPPEYTPGRQGALSVPSPTLATWNNPWQPMPTLATGAAGRDGEITVTVDFTNAPEWLRKPDIETTASGRGIKTAVNVGYSMAFAG